MPYITVECGALTAAQKEELLRRLTETAAEVMQIPQEFFAATVKELSDQNYAIGGRTIDRIKAEYRRGD